MAFNIVDVGKTDEEKEELLEGVGKCMKPPVTAVVASPVPQQATVVPVVTPAAYGATFPYTKGQPAAAGGVSGDEPD